MLVIWLAVLIGHADVQIHLARVDGEGGNLVLRPHREGGSRRHRTSPMSR